MTITNGRPKTYADVLEEIFKNRELIKLKIMKEKEEELAAKKNLPTSDDKIMEELKLRLLKQENLSVPYVVRKYKVNADKARELIVTVSRHECWEWDGMVIDALSVEYKCACHCFKE